MKGRSPNRLKKALSWLPNLAVLSALLGIGWWGHSTHWTVPRFSALLGSQAAGKADFSAGVGPDRHAAADLLHHLPAIELHSREAARNCGIVTGVALKRSMDVIVTAAAAVQYDPTRIAQLSVRTPGVVWRVEKRVGDAVARGDVLAIIDSAEVGDTKASLLEAAALYQLKADVFERYRSRSDVVAERQVREAAAAKEVARAQLFKARQKLANLGFALRNEDIAGLSVRELEKRLRFLGLPESLHDERASANLIPLVAPFAGVITRCEVVYGETVEPSKVQYIMADTTHMVIDLDVREEDAARLRMGSPVKFSRDRASRPVTGTLVWIGTEIDPRTRMVQARAAVANPLIDDHQTDNRPQRLLKANTFGTASILVTKNPPRLVVPKMALHWQWEIGQRVVFVPLPDGRSFLPRVVRAGGAQNQQVQILEGLKPGEKIVTAGGRVLSTELSQRLQQWLGDNAQAVRDFGTMEEISQSADRAPSENNGKDAVRLTSSPQ